MARSITTNPLHVFRFHAQWGEELHDLSLSKASFITMGGIGQNGNLTLKRALYGNDDAMLKFLSSDKEERLLLHLYHIESGYDTKTRCWTDPRITIEFSGIVPASARLQRRVELDARCSDVLEMEIMVNFTKMRFIQGGPDAPDTTQAELNADWSI